MLRSLLALGLVLTALAVAPAPAPGPAGRVEAEGQRSSDKYALDGDPNSSGWTQGSQLPQGTGVQSASGFGFENTATNPKYILPSQPTSGSWTGQTAAQPESARAETAAHVEDIAPASPNFVTTDGIHFTLDGSIKYFPGSNDYFLILRYFTRIECSMTSEIARSLVAEHMDFQHRSNLCAVVAQELPFGWPGLTILPGECPSSVANSLLMGLLLKVEEGVTM